MKANHKAGQIVAIRWADATSKTDQWHEKKDLPVPAKIWSVGKITHLPTKKEPWYCVSADFSAVEGDDEVGRSMTIPSGWILEIKPIEIVLPIEENK